MYEKQNKCSREFYEINFETDIYRDLIDCQLVTLTKPQLVVCFSDKELKVVILNISVEIDVLRSPCHSEAVEPSVKVVVEASAVVCGNDKRG